MARLPRPATRARSDQNGQQQQAARARRPARPASDALNQLSDSAAAAGERQRTASQLESSRNALERALGRTQSRSGSTRSSSTSHHHPASAARRTDRAANGDQNGDPSQARRRGQGQAATAPIAVAAARQAATRATAETLARAAATRPAANAEPSRALRAAARHDHNPAAGTQQQPVRARREQRQPVPRRRRQRQRAGVPAKPCSRRFSNKPTQGNDSGSIPLGLRDLVKDYFSSLDQK